MQDSYASNPELSSGSELSKRVAERIIASNEHYFVTYGSELDAETANLMWHKNDEGFEELNSNSINRQNMTQDEFLADIDNPDVLKYTVYEKNTNADPTHSNEAVGMLLVHRDAHRVDWLNQTYLAQLPDYQADGIYSYISTLVVDQGHRGLDASGLLIRSVAENIAADQRGSAADVGAIVDFAGANKHLPRMITYLLHAEAYGEPLPYEMRHLGAQIFESVDFNAPAELKLNRWADVLPADKDDGLRRFNELMHKTELTGVAKQGPSPESFKALLTAQGTEAYAVTLSADRGVIPVVIATDMGVAPYLSPSFIARKIGDSPIVYWPGASAYGELTSNDLQIVIDTVASAASRHDAHVIFDRSTESTHLEAVISNNAQSTTELDRQDYWVIQRQSDHANS